MRENKFKWVGRNKKFGDIWITDPLTTTDILNGIHPSFFSLVNRKPTGNCEFLAEVRFAGLKDKKGKEIFEGDIILEDGAKGTVIFQASAFVIDWEMEDVLVDPLGWNNNNRARVVEVIGNIYENPEILK